MSPSAIPSIVVIVAPSACAAKRLQDFTDSPFRCTIQAPHWLVSQPTWVPVSYNVSLRNVTSSVLSGTSWVAMFPFTFIDTVSNIVSVYTLLFSVDN